MSGSVAAAVRNRRNKKGNLNEILHTYYGKETLIAKAQGFVRYKMYMSVRLHAKNVAERLIFEATLLRGLFRFCNQLAIFALLLIALSYSGDPSAQLGIYTNLKDSFDFESIANIKSKEAFIEILPMLSKSAKRYFTLSSQYFQTKGKGDVQLIGEMQFFPVSEALGGVDITIQAPTVSFTAWVKTTPQFARGYLIRKRPASSGSTAGLACWSWFLDAQNGPSLHFGAHDFAPYDTTTFQHPEIKQATVSPNTSVKFPPQTYFLLTVVVNDSYAVFYRNIEMLGNTAMPRPITDCDNNQEGVLVGDTDMELGQLRFYPRALTAAQVEEIYQFGLTLGDISTGSEPISISQGGLDMVKRSIENDLSQVHSAVVDGQYLSEVMSVAETAINQPEELYAAPRMPEYGVSPYEFVPESWNMANASHVTKVDSEYRSYHQIFTGPYKFSKTIDGGLGVHACAGCTPSFSGTGVTFSFWYRHFSCPDELCGAYAFSLFRFDSGKWEMQMELYMEENSMYFDSTMSGSDGGYRFFKDYGVEEKFNLNGDKMWRHLALQLDEDDTLRFFIDGALVFEEPLQTSTPVTALSNQELRLGFVDYSDYWGAVSMADFRVYVHDEQGRLTTTQVLSIAQGPTPFLNSLYKCVPSYSPELLDQNWKDGHGRDCQWYFNAKKIKPSVCDLKEAYQKCPQSCGRGKGKLECFAPARIEPGKDDVYFAWDTIRLITPSHSNGTLCLGQELSKKKIVEECHQWVSKGVVGSLQGDSRNYSWNLRHMHFEGYPSGWESRWLNLTDCEVLETVIDKSCDFDLKQVRDFTQQTKTSDGWSIGFWVRPVSDDSFTDGQFIPALSLYHSISPPDPFFSVQKDIHWPYSRMSGYSYGADKNFYINHVEAQPFSLSEWSFIAYANRFPDENGIVSDIEQFPNVGMQNARKFNVLADYGVKRQGLKFTQAMNDSAEIFKAIEVNVPMLISPIMMVPRYLTATKMQEEYIKRIDDMSVRTGPLDTNKIRVRTRVQVEKDEFLQHSTLMSAPIIFQTMAKKTTTCPFSYSSKFMAKMHAKAIADKCNPLIYTCDEDVLQNVESIMSCIGEAEDNVTFFGLEPTTFDGDKGYADFLSSIADNSFVFRDELMPTKDFISSATQQARVVMVFFTPSSGIVSLLDIKADFSGFGGAEVSTRVWHYAIIEGENLQLYIIVQSLVIVNITIMFIDAVSAAIKAVRDWRKGDFNAHDLVEPIIDVLSGALVLVYIVLMFQQKTVSASETETILNDLESIPWSSPSVALLTKLGSFFETIAVLMALISQESFNNVLCNVILLINLFRVIQCTSLHPRLALLTGTVSNALDDLWHTALLTALLMLCFAGIGTWRFGNSVEKFSSFERTLQTEFEMLFGGFSEEWASDPQLTRELQTFTVLYLIVLFLLVLNFLLAIIVEAYMKVREKSDAQETEGEFFSDIMNSLSAGVQGMVYGWPRRQDVGTVVGKWEAKLSVGYKDLQKTGLFQSSKAIVTFLSYYSRFDFLVPPVVGKYGILPTGSDELAHRKMSILLNNKISSLQNQVKDAIKVVANRRETKGLKQQAAEVLSLLADQDEEGETHDTGVHSSKSQLIEQQLDKMKHEIQDDLQARLNCMQDGVVMHLMTALEKQRQQIDRLLQEQRFHGGSVDALAPRHARLNTASSRDAYSVTPGTLDSQSPPPPPGLKLEQSYREVSSHPIRTVVSPMEQPENVQVQATIGNITFHTSSVSGSEPHQPKTEKRDNSNDKRDFRISQIDVTF